MSKECKRTVNTYKMSLKSLFFAVIMLKNKRFYVFKISAVLLLLCFSCHPESGQNDISSKTKLVLRAVGNELLLSQNDSTSLVMPVVQMSQNEYHLSFEKPIKFDPKDLQEAVKVNIAKVKLPNQYKVEVVRCDDGEIGYSYLLSGPKEEDIIPCGGRLLPENCFNIQFTYLNEVPVNGARKPLFYFLVFLVLAFLAFVFYSRYSAHNEESNHVIDNGKIIGSFNFYPDQNKLVKAATEIPLSKKECELLEILVSNVNQIVKRESLEKQVWEDQGVVVGRSLDTYISKLRKKLKSDTTLKIVNIHGVGYKLEMLA